MKRENRPVALAEAPATASLSAHSGAKLVTLAELKRIPTPEPTKTWKPIGHADVPKVIEEMVAEKGWKFGHDGADRFKLAVTPNGAKMFGVTDIMIPDIETDAEFGLALGFRNSHDKSFALRMALGAKVFICDNLMVSGDVQVRRIHWVNIDIRVLVEEALAMIPAAAAETTKWFSSMKKLEIGPDQGVALLAKCVEAKALPMMDFMDARAMFLGINDSADPADHPQHMGTVWAACQSVTAMYKRHSLLQTQTYSTALNDVVKPLLLN